MSQSRLSRVIESSSPTEEMTTMYNPLNAELMLLQADELRREMQAAHRYRGSRRWWRRDRGNASPDRVERRAG
jgi:hypothetical protein